MDFSISKYYCLYVSDCCFLKKTLHIYNRKNQLYYNLIYRIRVHIHCILLFNLITTICNMICLLNNVTLTSTITFLEVMDQSCCRTCSITGFQYSNRGQLFFKAQMNCNMNRFFFQQIYERDSKLKFCLRPIIYALWIKKKL